MGRNGPAFLAYPNFDVYLQWNQSLVYATTAAYFATRLAGAPPRFEGNAPVDALSFNEIKQIQHILQTRGYDVGGVDGMIGANTRSAVRDVQTKLGLPVDGYPTQDLLRSPRRQLSRRPCPVDGRRSRCRPFPQMPPVRGIVDTPDDAYANVTIPDVAYRCYRCRQEL